MLLEREEMENMNPNCWDKKALFSCSQRCCLSQGQSGLLSIPSSKPLLYYSCLTNPSAVCESFLPAIQTGLGNCWTSWTNNPDSLKRKKYTLNIIARLKQRKKFRAERELSDNAWDCFGWYCWLIRIYFNTRFSTYNFLNPFRTTLGLTIQRLSFYREKWKTA